MTDWDGYEVDVRAGTPPNALPRPEARRAFNQLMTERPRRIELLRSLLRASGIDIDLTPSDEGIQRLNDWFAAAVEADPRVPGQLALRWYSVVQDVGLFLGDVLIGRCPGLRWELFTGGKRNVAYQHPVVTGFSKAPYPKYSVDFAGYLRVYGHRIIAKRGSVPTYGTVAVRGVEIDIDEIAARHREQEIEGDAFVRWLGMAAPRA